MKVKYLIYAILSLFAFSKSLCNTDLPQIAIISQPQVVNGVEDYSQLRVAATYVNWLFASGAGTIVVHPHATVDELDDILTKAKGVLLQGGLNPIIKETRYMAQINNVFQRIVQLQNEKGIKIPILGIDQGFQTLHYLISDRNFLSVKVANSKWLPASFDLNQVKNAKLFSLFEERDFDSLRNKPTTFHQHKFGIDPIVYEQDRIISNFLKITSTAVDEAGNAFVASMEAKNYPIYGTQFHPEEIINHDPSIDAIRISRAIGNFFVNLSKTGNGNKLLPVEYKKYNHIDPYTMYPVLIEESYFYIYQGYK